MTITAAQQGLEAVRWAGTDLRALGCRFDVIDVAMAPPVRGSNLLIPYQPGQRPLPRIHDQRVIVLQGTLFPGSDRAGWMAAVDQVKTLFQVGAGEQRLEVARTDGSLRYSMCQVTNTLGLEYVLQPFRWGAFSIELTASDPYWYGSALECAAAREAWWLDGGAPSDQYQGLLALFTPGPPNLYTGSVVFLDDGTHWLDSTAPSFARVLASSPATVEATNAGDYPTRRPVFVLQGTMPALKIANLRNGLSLTLNRSVVGQLVVIDCGAQQVTIAGAPQLGAAVTLGANQTDWMRLEAGENTLSISGLGPPVAYQAQYSPAFL